MGLTKGMDFIMCAIVKSIMGMRSAMDRRSSLIGQKTQASYDQSSKKIKKKVKAQVKFYALTTKSGVL